MKIFKFGGASVKDAKGVKNLVKVLKSQGVENTFIVISAMGKMTNAFEKIVNSYFYKEEELKIAIQFTRDFHFQLLKELFEDTKHPVYLYLDQIYAQISGFFIQNKSKDYNFIYDQIVPFGELLSTKIVSEYLNEIGIENNWLDVREFIKTDAIHRDAKVDWNQTERIISSTVDMTKLNITQGFLGGYGNITTTLGREGSDYTAAIFAYCLNAESVTIWKDVDGVLNANPTVFRDTVLLNQISYKEAIEMAYYGASVIHHKTLKPLENKLIPLHVRSFIDYNKKGTTVRKGNDLEPKVPCFIQKKNQILVSISTLDFSFIVENNLSDIFKYLHDFKLKVNLIQNSAISFSVCIEDKFGNFDAFFEKIHNNYKVYYNDNVTLYTIRHFDQESISRIEKNNKVLLKQTSRETIQILIE
ncbi:aspartate kinase [Urechidicola croceus]|uniref:Aspartokinase n=1 Tax=Urechidicola croceus TaxID=1850246 RepID=A0A1D8P8R5_9FLAO|nr:aspartate kinase [Urechidicola croceus]AOW20973.1 aspartate kinase [Urechidicola croceus]